MSNLSGLPPPYVAKAAMQAITQDVLVRIVQLPDSLQNNQTAQKLTGTVVGQSPDGSVKLQTDQGVINVMMKDRGGLPDGTKLDIEIPVGRPPQQANIKAAPQNIIQAQSQNQNAPTPVANNILTTAAITASNIKLERMTNLSTTDMQEILTNVKPDGIITAKPTTLNIGETIRLNAALQTPQTGNTAPIIQNTEADLIQTLLSFISNANTAPDDPAVQKLIQTMRQLSFFTGDAAQTPSQILAGKKMLAQLQNLSSNAGLPPLSIRQNDAAMPTLQRTFDARILAILPTQNNAPAPISITPAQSAPVMVGQIETDGTGNLPMLRIISGAGLAQIFSIPFPVTNVTNGQMVLLQPLLTSADNAELTPQTLMNWIKSGTWDSLNALLTQIQSINPTMSAPLMAQLPSLQNSSQNNPLALIFMAMLKGGEIENWVPAQVMNVLREQNKTNLLRPLQNDQAILSRLDTITLNNEWKLNMFPFWHDGNVQKMPLYYKSWDEKDNKDDENRRKKMRFLFDLNLTRMGKIQVDGFFVGEDKTPRLDMIIRAEQALSPPMQQRMKNIYIQSIERSNLNGELSFQFRPDQWVNSDEILVSV